ncbi:ABC transporter permease [Conexibacter sp. S30A1]|jgi:ribose transport system permease protein|uniref:ABC transporter permease n=1 Tax=Conexibacter sp. S30A1 TaxID=2937800 RepID=UPI00200C6FCA|nr:ABC transporter permease [Conexibacter sp. S30A1]
MSDVTAPEQPQEVTPTRGPRIRATRDLGIVVFLVGIFAALAIAAPSFRTSGNLSNIVNQMSMQGIAACGATLTIVSGGFDLSQGSVYAFCAILSVMLVHTFGVLGAFVIAVLAGLGLGAINGAIIALGRVNSFIATLATSYVFLGFATVITQGNVATTSNQNFMVMNNTYGLTVASWVFIAIAVLLGILLAYTRFGRGLYAIGGNPEAARLSGINISFYRIAVFSISGACAGAAGIIAASQAGSADSSIGSTLALLAIASSVVGGVSILGGQGAVWRAVVGALILELINNGFVLLNLNPVYEDVVFGLLVLLAVGMDQLLRRRRT